jgi:exodeoxyribonuclease VII small subunit
LVYGIKQGRETALAELPAEISKLGFEEALAELERIVRQLEEGKGRLDEAIDAYSRGILLKRHCETKLAEAQARVDRIVMAPDGSLGVQPVDFS